MTNAAQRSYGIDLARTIAILGVVLVHSGCFDNGRFGVQLFFLVSGYLLADLGNLSNRNFLIRRGFRLFPLYWLVLVLFYHSNYNSLWQLFGSLFLIQSTHWIFSSFPGAWSISNEWLFSLLLPLFKKITRNQILVLIGISWLGQFFTSYLVHKLGGFLTTDNDYQYALKTWINTLNPGINLAFFLIGIGLKKELLPILKKRSIAFLIVIFGQLISYSTGHGLLFMWPPILWAIFSICLSWSPQSTILKTSVAFIGQRTYGIFFFHFIILGPVQNSTLVKQLSENYGVKNWVVFVLTILTSAFLSEVSWRFLESPCIKISRRYIKR
jgi:peptidoglycan/LPS O-acetylase OafA/YrhL